MSCDIMERMCVYEPAEDSFLLVEAVKEYAKGTVLDIGTGTGIQAITAKKNKKVTSVVATDINNQALNRVKQERITVRRSDIFSNIKERFTTIICNPPYLPQDTGIDDPAIYGGGKGYEFIARLLANTSKHLKPEGQLLLLFSSLTNKKKVDELITLYGFEKEKITEKRLFAETLYVYGIKKSDILKKLERRGLKDIRVYVQGKRSTVWLAALKRKKVVVKITTPQRVKNEVYWLKKLSTIAPALYFSDKDFFCSEFIQGKTIQEVMKHGEKSEQYALAKKVLRQCVLLDKMKVTKEEMHNPRKHVIQSSRKVVMIDFERAKRSEQPKNVTQFCQYLARWLKKPVLITLARKYKKDYEQQYVKLMENELC